MLKVDFCSKISSSAGRIWSSGLLFRWCIDSPQLCDIFSGQQHCDRVGKIDLAVNAFKLKCTIIPWVVWLRYEHMFFTLFSLAMAYRPQFNFYGWEYWQLLLLDWVNLWMIMTDFSLQISGKLLHMNGESVLALHL